MQDTIIKLCKQVHGLLPEKRIAITRFMGKYEYGQIYIGELDRNVKREPCGYMFAKRNFCLVYSQDPTKPQEEARQDFEFVCTTLEDNAPFLYDPRWYKVLFDVFETSLIIEFEVWERYERKLGEPLPTMETTEFDYPKVVYEGGGSAPSPEPPEPEPPEPPAPVVPDFDGQGSTGTMRVWGDVVSIGTGRFEFGNVVTSGIMSSDLKLVTIEPQIGGLVTT